MENAKHEIRGEEVVSEGQVLNGGTKLPLGYPVGEKVLQPSGLTDKLGRSCGYQFEVYSFECVPATGRGDVGYDFYGNDLPLGTYYKVFTNATRNGCPYQASHTLGIYTTESAARKAGAEYLKKALKRKPKGKYGGVAEQLTATGGES